MAENTDLTTAQDGDSELVQQLRDSLRGVMKERDEALATSMHAQKRLAFRDIGINPDKGVGKLFYESYKGDLTEEAVKAAAQEYELPLGQQGQQEQSAPVQQEQPKESPEERAAHQSIDNSVEHAGAAHTQTDPEAAGWDAFEKTMQTTGSRDKAMASHFDSKLAAALKAQQGG